MTNCFELRKRLIIIALRKKKRTDRGVSKTAVYNASGF